MKVPSFLDMSVLKLAVFPLLLLVMGRISLCRMRMPGVFVAAALVLALIGTGFAYVYLPAADGVFLVSRLQGDPYEVQSRIFRTLMRHSFENYQNSGARSRIRRYHASPAGKRQAFERMQQMRERMKALGSNIEMADLIYQGERNHVTDYLTGLGWDVTARSVEEAHADNGFQYPDDDLSRAWTQLKYVRAVLGQKA